MSLHESPPLVLIDGEAGIWHLANEGAVSWVECVRHAAVLAGYDPALVQPVRGAQLGRPARRPSYSALASARGQLLAPLEVALAHFVAACDPDLLAPAREAAEPVARP